ncbi:MAG: 16S rRNA (guanine(966)-N(2))-methyltransferase RsmD [Thermogutta sp.]
MAKRRSKTESEGQSSRRAAIGLRIIGGRLRGRRLLYSGAWSTRPMRDRVREAVFNILRDAVVDVRVIDIFAGTGAMGLEALSRGATFATFIERDAHACRILNRNVTALHLADQAEVLALDAFVWWRYHSRFSDDPHVVFCCPPYEIFEKCRDEMLQLVTGLIRELPNDSVLVVEAGDDFDFHQFPFPDRWDIRTYRPSRIGFFWKSSSIDEAA